MVKVVSTVLHLEIVSSNVEEDDTVILTCIADIANPVSSIMWYYGSVRVTDNVEDNILPGDYNSYSSISFLTWTANRNDNGVIYTCKVDGTDLEEEDKVMNISCE